MSIILSDKITGLLNDPDTIKVLATVDGQGNPHAVIKKSLHSAEDGTIHFLEILEASNTGRNLTGSLWFGHKVSILLFGKDGRQVQIKGNPQKCHISGSLFLNHYVKLRERLGDVDLAGVWVIEPEEVIDESFADRNTSYGAERPTFIHLDRIAKETVGGEVNA